jgi:hypothetical protein
MRVLVVTHVGCSRVAQFTCFAFLCRLMMNGSATKSATMSTTFTHVMHGPCMSRSSRTRTLDARHDGPSPSLVSYVPGSAVGKSWM